MLLQKPDQIYHFILSIISNIELELSATSSNNELDVEKQALLLLIREYRKNILDKTIAELKNNQEWNIFTIAFYG